MEDLITISSIRISKNLAEKLDFVSKREGISKTELIRRSLEQYLKKEFSPKLKTGEELLELIFQRTGHKPKIIRDIKSVFKENYKEEPL
jgi:metal-responsive CopG/Arc/MetJ family transcriptional regulator